MRNNLYNKLFALQCEVADMQREIARLRECADEILSTSTGRAEW
jgi:hypothetical protein